MIDKLIEAVERNGRLVKLSSPVTFKLYDDNLERYRVVKFVAVANLAEPYDTVCEQVVGIEKDFTWWDIDDYLGDSETALQKIYDAVVL